MALTDAGRNAAVDGLAAVVTHVSVHSAPPDNTGSNELPGVARQAVTWRPATAGVSDNAAALTHDIGAGQTAAFYGLWTAATGGTFIGSVPRTGAGEGRQGFGTADPADDLIRSAGHGLTSGDRIVVHAVLGEQLPGGLAEGVGYHVVGATVDTFQVSLSAGGAPVDITSAGELFFQRFVPETFASAGQLQVDIGALDLSAAVI